VLIGKVHFIGPDQAHGFDPRLVDDSRVWVAGSKATTGAIPPRRRPNARRRVLRAGAGRTDHADPDEQVLAAALDLLERRGRAAATRRPLFCCVSFNARHFPLLAPAHFDSYWPDAVDRPRIEPGELDTQHPFHHRLRSYFNANGLTPATVLRARAAYCALVTWMNGMLGRIVDAVDAMAPAPDPPPLLIHAPDHGEMIGEHGLWWKTCFFEETARVPLIMGWPGRIAPGTRTAAPVTLIELLLTPAGIAGAEARGRRGRAALPGAGRRTRGCRRAGRRARHRPCCAVRVPRPHRRPADPHDPTGAMEIRLLPRQASRALRACRRPRRKAQPCWPARAGRG
jgi:choline-sulfatase